MLGYARGSRFGACRLVFWRQQTTVEHSARTQQPANTMKAISTNRNRLRTLVTAATLLGAAQFAAQAATIYYVGTLTNSAEAVNWLTPATNKTYDIDGDNKYGSYCAVHWRVLGTYTASSLSFIGSGGQYKQPEYPKINNLADATMGNVGPGVLINNNPTNDNASIALTQHTFQINEDLTGKVLRVGVMEDILGPAEYPRDTHKGVRLVQTVGGSDWSVVVPLPNADGKPEMVFFDIVGAQVSDQYRVEEVRDVGGTDAITTYVGPVSWDTNVTTAVATAPMVVAVSGDDYCRTSSDYVLGVLAGGAPPPTYQWYRGAAAITGATDAVLWLTNVTVGDSATYKVAATTPAGAATSAPVALTVLSSNLPSRITGYRAAVVAEPSLLSYYTFDNGANDNVGRHGGTIAGTPAVGYKLGPGAGRGID